VIVRVGRGRPRQSQRGNVIILFALVLPILIGFLSLSVDVGHLLRVRSELQNAADAAAWAAVRDLDGRESAYAAVRQSAVRLAAEHRANGTIVAVDPNTANADDGEVVLGIWDCPSKSFSAATWPPTRVNAVKVRTRRTAASGGAVTTFFAGLFGLSQKDLVATAVGVGGSPQLACAFPFVVPDCSIIDGGGNLRCNATLTFGDAGSDNVGFTVLEPTGPVSTPLINCAVTRALGVGCPAGCDCTGQCNESSLSEGAIYVSNGNNLSTTVIDAITAAVAAAPDGILVNLPVLDSGGLSQAGCGGFAFNRPVPVIGYVKLRLTGAQFGPPKAVYGSVDCSQTDSAPAGGALFGLRSVNPYLVQ